MRSDAVLWPVAQLCIGYSKAAPLLLPGSAGNAEALAVTRLKASEVDEVLTSGLHIVEEPALLLTSLPPAASPEPAAAVRIIAAHHEHGELLVEFATTSSSQSVELVIDGRVLAGDEIRVGDGVVRINSVGVVNRVQVAAIIGGERHLSAEHWVDHEFMLSATSRQRQMGQALGDHVAPGQWSFQGWTEVLRLLGDHLAHTPTNVVNQEQNQRDDKEEPPSVSASEFFTEDYRLPGHRREAGRLNETGRIVALRGLLLDYFGISNDDHVAQTIGEEDGDDDTVDKPVAATTKEPIKLPKKAKLNLTDAERRRGQRIAGQIVDVCTSRKFAENRPASMLASDLAIVAVLLVSGHAEGWLSSDDFLDMTYRVWSFLFFDDGTDENGRNRSEGALARRHDASSAPRQFEESIRSVRLAAALATWCFCCPKGVAHAEATRFEVATRLAVARLPWLWFLEARDQIEHELFEIARRTEWLGPDVDRQWGQVVSRWESLFAEGRAIALLEHTLTVTDSPVCGGQIMVFGAITRTSASLASSAARWRARSDRSPSALA